MHHHCSALIFHCTKQRDFTGRQRTLIYNTVGMSTFQYIQMLVLKLFDIPIKELELRGQYAVSRHKHIVV